MIVFSIFSHHIIWHTHSTQCSGWACPVICQELSRWWSCGTSKSCNVIQFTERVHSHLILEIAVMSTNYREKPIVRDGIAAQFDCEWCRYAVFQHLFIKCWHKCYVY